MPTYVILWQYDIDPQQRTVFEQVYGSDGDWALLFRNSPDYLGTQLFRDLAQTNRYLTIDHWHSKISFMAFMASHAAAYAGLDEQCARLTVAEVALGAFDRADP